MAVHLLTFHIARDASEMSELCAALHAAKRLQYLDTTRGYPEWCAMHFPNTEAAQTWAGLHESEICEVQIYTLEMQGV